MNHSNEGHHNQDRGKKGAFETLRDFVLRHERLLSALSLIVGFLIDQLTLGRIDEWRTHVTVLVLFSLATSCILFSQYSSSGRKHSMKLTRFSPFFPVVIQLSFGALFSVLFILYSRSASLVESWPFMLALGILLIGNEFFKKRYDRFDFQTSVLFFVAFALLIFYIPLIFGNIGSVMFMASGAVAVSLFAMLMLGLYFVDPVLVRNSRRIIGASIAVIYVSVNLLYFARLIPPIPLVLKTHGVYHSVVRDPAGRYLLTGESVSWGDRLPWSTKEYTKRDGSPLFYYTAIFAPIDLSASVVHEWQYLDQVTGEWTPRSKIEFPISGGRENGYRGYSIVAADPGTWRVSVETTRGEVLGREVFQVRSTTGTEPPMVTVVE